MACNVALVSGILCIGTGALEDAGIPYTPAVGAIFLLIDLRKALAQPTWAVRALSKSLPPYKP